MDMVVKDPKGKWFKLIAPFPFHDTISDTMFWPGVLTKATETDRTKSNTRLVVVEDPSGAPEGLKKSVAPKLEKVV
jgi:hypothetical protein